MKYFTAVLLLVCTVQALAHSDGDLRLIDGVSTSMGRVQLYYQGQWGVICSYNSIGLWYHGDTVAQVICRSLGFSDSRPIRFSMVPSGDRKLLDPIRCVGNERNILQCDHGVFGDTNCGTRQEMAVDCYGLEIGSRVELRNGTSTDGVLVLGNNHGQLGTVCREYWNHKNANVACRMLGVDTSRFHPVSLNSTYYGEVTTDPIDLSDLSSQVYCDGSEMNLTQCRHIGVYYASHLQYCQNSNNIALDCHGSENIEVSLVNGNDTAGEVQVTYRGESLTLCGPSGASGAVAKVVCRMLGYGDYEGVMLEEVPISTNMTAQISNCYGHEKDIFRCEMLLYSPCNQAYRIACRPQPDIAVRLVGGDERSGFLEIRRNGLWGSICRSFISVQDDRNVAQVVCRMLNLPTENAEGSNEDSNKPRKILLNYAYCAGDESNLNQCFHSKQEIEGCDTVAGLDAWIICA